MTGEARIDPLAGRTNRPKPRRSLMRSTAETAPIIALADDAYCRAIHRSQIALLKLVDSDHLMRQR